MSTLTLFWDETEAWDCPQPQMSPIKDLKLQEEPKPESQCELHTEPCTVTLNLYHPAPGLTLVSTGRKTGPCGRQNNGPTKWATPYSLKPVTMFQKGTMQMRSRLKILRWVVYAGLSGWSNVITWAFKSRRPFLAVVRELWDRKVRRMQCCWFWWWKKSHKPRNRGSF